MLEDFMLSLYEEKVSPLHIQFQS